MHSFNRMSPTNDSPSVDKACDRIETARMLTPILATFANKFRMGARLGVPLEACVR